MKKVAAVMPIPFQGFYSATKAAINLMSGAMRNEARQFGIEICCVMPSQIANVIYKAATKRHTKPLYTSGLMYKGAIVLGKLLPARTVYWLIEKIYIKK